VTAHKLARYVYAMLKHGQAYVSQGLEEYEAAMRQRMERALRKKARALGSDLVPQGPVDGSPLRPSALSASHIADKR